MFRDFSESGKTRLLDYIADVADPSVWGKIQTEVLSMDGAAQKWIAQLGIAPAVDQLESFAQTVTDEDAKAQEQVKDIFAKVGQIDANYADALSKTKSSLTAALQLMKDLAETIDPSGGNLDLKSRGSILAADVEQLKSSKSTAQKEVEENMLGMEPGGAKMSEDPVNLSTGNFVYEHKDLWIGGEIPLSFTRYYNAMGTYQKSLGKGFLHSYACTLEITEDGKRRIGLFDGAVHTYEKQGDGSYLGQKAADGRLTETNDGYLLIRQDQSRQFFDQSGKLRRREDANGRGITFFYAKQEANGSKEEPRAGSQKAGLEEAKLEEARTDTGASLFYMYEKGTGHLIRVTDHSGRCVKLSYQKGLLDSVETAEGAVYRYGYNADGRITETIDACGITSVRNTYDAKRRIRRQEFADHGITEFSYEEDKKQVVMIERDGSRTVFFHDDRYRNTKTQYADGTQETFLYNERNQCIARTDRLGRTTRMSYDTNGNLTQLIDPMKQRTNWTYDAAGRLLKLSVHGKEKLKREYDAKGNLTGISNALGEGICLYPDEQGRLQEIVEADGGRVSLTYDERGNIKTLKRPFGGVYRYVYDTLNRVIESTDANGNTTVYTYDKADRIQKVRNPQGQERTYAYNEEGQVTVCKDYDGYCTKTTYHPLGLVESVSDKEGHVTRYTYDAMWNVSRQRDPDGSEHVFTYDGDGNCIKRRLPQGGELTDTYDAAGNQTSRTDAMGYTTTYAYDAADRLIEETDAQGAKTSYAYDREGNLSSRTDALGHTTTYTYDGMGRRTGIVDALGNETKLFYTKSGAIERIVYPNQSEERYQYHPGGKLATVTYADETKEHYHYDLNENLTGITDTAGGTTTYAYDEGNRVVRITNPAGGVRTFAYDAAGNITKTVEESGRETDYAYSPNGNLIRVTDACGHETKYTYDCMGRLIRVQRKGEEHEEARETDYQRDQSGLVSAVKDPLGEIERYLYDPMGRMTAKIKADGTKTAYAYRPSGALSQISYADQRSVAFSYNALEQLIEIKDWIGTTKIEPDALGRPTSVTDPMGETISYTWGSMGEKTSMTYPDQTRAVYTYHKNLQLIQMEVEQEGEGTKREKRGRMVTYAYDPYGRLQETKLPGGVKTSYAYGALGRITEILHEGAGSRQRYQYTYDAAGHKIQSRKEEAGKEEENYTYAYDALGRISEIRTNGAWSRRYAYDAFGNRISMQEREKGLLQEREYAYNKGDRLIERRSGEQKERYRYDKRGNLIEVSCGQEVLQSFTYNAQERMEQAMYQQEGEIKEISYTYNGLGYRIKEEQQKSLFYTLDLTRPYQNLLQKKEAGKEAEDFYWGHDLAFFKQQNETYSYLQDDLGSVTALLTKDGEVKEAYAYDVFGMQSVRRKEGEDLPPGKSMQPFGFTGYQREVIEGMYYAQAREYDAGSGRFFSEDPIKGILSEPMTQNPYLYCRNQPLDWVDRDGLCPKKEQKKGISEEIKELMAMLQTGKADEDFMKDAHMSKAEKRNFSDAIAFYSKELPKSPQEALIKTQMLMGPNGWIVAGSALKEAYALKKDRIKQATRPAAEFWDGYAQQEIKKRAISTGIIAGVSKGIKSMLDGVGNLANKEIEFYDDPVGEMKKTDAQIHQIKEIFAKGQEGEVLAGIGKGLVEEIKDSFYQDVIHGNTYTRSEYAGEVALEIGSWAFGLGEAKKGMEALKVAKEAKDGEKILKKTGDAAKSVGGSNADDLILKGTDYTVRG